MKKKIIILSAVIIGLPIIIYLILGSFKTGTEIVELFSYDKSEQIDKIILSKPGFDDLTLQFNDNKWILNSKFEARKESVDLLFKTIQTLKIKSPIASKEIPGILKKIQEQKHTIKAYSGRELLFEWNIGDYEPEFKATYMQDSQNNEPYLVNIPGIADDLTKRFEVVELFWRTDKIFDYSPSQIKKISVEYTETPENSFEIENNAGKLTIKKFSGNEVLTNVEEKTLLNYMNNFSDVRFDYIFTDLSKSKRDSLLSQIPFHKIKITDNKDITQEIKTYRRPDSKTGSWDLDKLNASINDDKDVVVVSYYTLDLILKNPGYFLKK